MKKEKIVEEKVIKTSYPKVLDEITFDVELGKTHAVNAQNTQYLLGEKSMLEKVKKALS